MNITIITTPNIDLKETGFGAIQACNSVFDSIQKLGHSVEISVCTCLNDLDQIVEQKPDLAILAVKYISIENGEDIWLSEYFEEKGINFSGSSRDVLRFDSDKVLAKTFLMEKGVKSAKFFTAIPGQFNSESDLPLSFPLFLKPSDAANGNGIDDLSLVRNFSQFESKILSLFSEFGMPVLVEEFLDGKEFSVAVISPESGKLIVSAVEVIPAQSENGLRILGEKAKKDDSESMEYIEDHHILGEITQLAIDVYIKLGIWDFGRIDIKADKNGQYFFMEANLVPGMTFGSSYFPKACEIANNLTYDEVIQFIVEKGISRAKFEKPFSTSSASYEGIDEPRSVSR